MARIRSHESSSNSLSGNGSWISARCARLSRTAQIIARSPQPKAPETPPGLSSIPPFLANQGLTSHFAGDPGEGVARRRVDRGLMPPLGAYAAVSWEHGGSLGRRYAPCPLTGEGGDVTPALLRRRIDCRSPRHAMREEPRPKLKKFNARGILIP